LTIMDIYNGTELHPNIHTKAFVKVPLTDRFDHVHIAVLYPGVFAVNIHSGHLVSGPFFDPNPLDSLYLLHFQLGSLEEFMIKRTRRRRADLTSGLFYEKEPTHCFQSFECAISEWQCLVRGYGLVYPTRPQSNDTTTTLVNCAGKFNLLFLNYSSSHSHHSVNSSPLNFRSDIKKSKCSTTTTMKTTSSEDMNVIESNGHMMLSVNEELLRTFHELLHGQ